MVVIDILLAGAVTYAALSSERGVLIALVAACVCLVCWQVAVFLRARRGALALGIERNIRLPHYLQAGVQACHYLYLGLYYPAVQEHLPLIAIQIVVFYAMEMLLQWSRGRNWRAGFGPLPVVGSINLFLWFAHRTSTPSCCQPGSWCRDWRSSSPWRPSTSSATGCGMPRTPTVDGGHR